jgi:hypothetical protein
MPCAVCARVQASRAWLSCPSVGTLAPALPVSNPWPSPLPFSRVPRPSFFFHHSCSSFPMERLFLHACVQLRGGSSIRIVCREKENYSHKVSMQSKPKKISPLTMDQILCGCSPCGPVCSKPKANRITPYHFRSSTY